VGAFSNAESVLCRRLFLRLLGLVYFIAFVSLAVQVTGLIGADGLRPAAARFERAREVLGGVDLLRLPTVFWLGASDGALVLTSWAGAATAVALMLGLAPLACLVVLWALYLSFAGIGSPFLGYQWDALLLETGFLALFWAPARLRLDDPRAPAPSTIVLWLFRWLVFRLMFFSGWVKLASGDPTWWDLTALEYHYWTQPLPAWTSWYAAHLPTAVQKLSCALTFVIELALPFLIPFGRRARAIACTGFVALQVIIGATGNYGFFNLLSVALCVTLLDDAQLRALLPGRFRRASVAPIAVAKSPSVLRVGASVAVAVLLILLTVPSSLSRALGRRGAWETASAPLAEWTGPFSLTSGYGLFAVMTTTRPEVVIEGSDDGEAWAPYVFRWKPGPLGRAPSFVQPHMPRLDWQMWFDGLYIERMLETGQRGFDAVTPSLLESLRRGSAEVLALLESDPFAGRPPRYVRWLLYQYRFTDAAERERTRDWWKRTLVHTSDAMG